ncbi:MAG: nucleoid-associated protein, partial [Colwellia sp.]
YNPANESITIYKVPPNLKDQLLALIASNANQSASQSQAITSEPSSEGSENEY